MSVSHASGDNQTAHTADTHTRHALSPAGNDLVETKGDRVAKVMAALKNNAVFAECASIVGSNGRTLVDCFAGPLFYVNNLKIMNFGDWFKVA